MEKFKNITTSLLLLSLFIPLIASCANNRNRANWDISREKLDKTVLTESAIISNTNSLIASIEENNLNLSALKMMNSGVLANLLMVHIISF